MINIFPEMTQKGKPVNKALCLAIAAILGLASCSAERVSNFPSYKLKIIQGNELNPRAVVSLRQGMTRDQVQLLLGTPLLRDAFHADRWDYTFNTSRNGIIKEQSNLTLYFETMSSHAPKAMPFKNPSKPFKPDKTSFRLPKPSRNKEAP